jgi:hypothetical protein
MVSRQQKIVAVVAIIVVVIIVSAGGLSLLMNQPPKPSMAEKMILKQGDIGSFGFQSSSVGQWPMDRANESSIFRATLSNETIHLYLRIDVFNSSNDSRIAFKDVLQSLTYSSENITLGDEAVYWQQNPRLPSMVFIRSNVMAWVQTQSYGVDYVWLRNATIALATLQLDRIDSYLTG